MPQLAAQKLLDNAALCPKQSREREMWVGESELSPRALRTWVESRSLAKRTSELAEIRRRENVHKRRKDKKRGEKLLLVVVKFGM